MRLSRTQTCHCFKAPPLFYWYVNISFTAMFTIALYKFKSNKMDFRLNKRVNLLGGLSRIAVEGLARRASNRNKASPFVVVVVVETFYYLFMPENKLSVLIYVNISLNKIGIALFISKCELEISLFFYFIF